MVCQTGTWFASVFVGGWGVLRFYHSFKVRRCIYLDTIQKGLCKSNWSGFAIALFSSTSRCLRFPSRFLFIFSSHVVLHQANLRLHMKCVGKFLRYNKYLNEYLKKHKTFICIRLPTSRRNESVCVFKELRHVFLSTLYFFLILNLFHSNFWRTLYCPSFQIVFVSN
jgi:hypothetical protein